MRYFHKVSAIGQGPIVEMIFMNFMLPNTLLYLVSHYPVNPASMSNHEQIVVAAALLCVLTISLVSSVAAKAKTPMHTSVLSGQQWVEELLDGYDGHFYDAFGMNKHIFHYLVEVLWQKAGLDDTKHVSLKEQLGIFLYTAVTGASNQKVQKCFQ